MDGASTHSTMTMHLSLKGREITAINLHNFIWRQVCTSFNSPLHCDLKQLNLTFFGSKKTKTDHMAHFPEWEGKVTKSLKRHFTEMRGQYCGNTNK